jgi:NAD(P)-dependent dehydrogenase (short-subunit alcohol dehydrogenase family)
MTRPGPSENPQSLARGLVGKVVLVAGATGGLGTAVAEAFVTAGAKVVALGRTPYRGAPEVHAITADLGDETAAERAVAEVVSRHGRIDVLVSLVGGFTMGEPVASLPTETWRHMMALNLDTNFFLCRAAVRPMLGQRAGRIITVGSRSAFQPLPGATAYAVSKAALVAFTENLAAEVRDTGVTANVLLPSIIDTPTNRRAMPDADFARWPTPAELAAVILFLAGPDAAIINGAAIPAYGRA